MDFELIVAISVLFLVIMGVLALNVDRIKETKNLSPLLEKKTECNKAADIFTSIYTAGDGASAIAHFDNLITIENKSSIFVQDFREVIQTPQRYAFMASDCGPTSESFFDDISEQLNTDNYGMCSDCYGNGCPSWFASKGIGDDVGELMANIDDYNVLYLEDPTLDYRQYKSTLEEWVSKGNALVLSEHVFCRYNKWAWNDYECNYAEGKGDKWEAFDVEFNQKGGSYGYVAEVIQEDEAYDLTLGERIDLEEESFIDNINATGYTVIAEYTNGRDAISYWSYGEGRVYYFGDFQVHMLTYPSKSFSDVIINLVEVAYSILIPGQYGDTSCTMPVEVYDAQFTGDVLIKNEDGIIRIENATG